MTEVSASKPYKIPESVLVVIHTDALDVLLIERADRSGYWQSVTGSRERLDEPLFETACREVHEETGIVVVRDGPSSGGAATAASSNETALVNRDALTDWQHAIEFEIYAHWRHRYAPGVARNVEHWFGLRVPAGIPIKLAPREHSRHAWWPWRDAAERCFSPSNRDAILQLPHRRGTA